MSERAYIAANKVLANDREESASIDCLRRQLTETERRARIAERALWLCCQNEVERQIAVNGSCALTVEETRGMWCKAAAMVEASDE